MEFDWNNPPFGLSGSVDIQDVEESFEDAFAVKLLPDSPRFSVQSRYFNLGVAANGTGIFTVYKTDGRSVRVIMARPFEKEEGYFYQKRMKRELGVPRGL